MKTTAYPISHPILVVSVPYQCRSQTPKVLSRTEAATPAVVRLRQLRERLIRETESYLSNPNSQPWRRAG